jgi:2-phospho-L-lactate guanylyltransferase
LNASLDAATAEAVGLRAEGVLVVEADLAAATAEDLLALADGTGVVLAPDATGTGTNALWRSPPDAITSAFGERSRDAHELAANLAGAPFRMAASARLAADVDTPVALAAVWALGPGPATREAMERMGLPVRLRLAG